MNEELFKETLAKNLVYYRKANNLTQSGLADKLNYSDKAVSKWERGESIPDLYTISLITELYGITFNDLCYEINEENLPNKTEENDNSESSSKLESIKKIIKPEKLPKMLITILSTSLIWFIATAVYVILKVAVPGITNAYLAFVVSFPLSFILLLIFACVWGNHLTQALCVTGLVWTFALFVHSLFINNENMALVYVIAIPFQVLIIFWYTLLHIIKAEKQKENNRR